MAFEFDQKCLKVWSLIPATGLVVNKKGILDSKDSW